MMSEHVRWLQPLVGLVALALLLLLATGCGEEPVGENSPTVGGECSTHSDCDERCLQSGFPGGMCTLTCESNGDCPPESSCIDIQDGVCLMDCSRDRDCPGGYKCSGERRHGHSGRSDVCVED